MLDKLTVQSRYILISITLIMISCKSELVLPKPHAYPKIVYPTGAQKSFMDIDCPLSFEFPTYGIIEKQTSFFNEKPADPCWFTIQVPSLNSSIHCSYGPINSTNIFDKYIEDSYNILSKHNIKAEYREERPLHISKDVVGMAFEIDGPVATPYQYYLTDRSNHFFRAALYFNSKVNPDSTRPVLEFLKKDIEHMQKTFAWKKR